MNSVKVIGASDRNLKALKMALTIKGPESKDGNVKADMKIANQPGQEGSFPFKMTIVNKDEQFYLNISEGRIGVTDWAQANSYLSCEGDNLIDLSVLEDEGVYIVMLACESAGENSQQYKSYVYFMNEADENVFPPPYTRGIFTTVLGKIEKKMIENEKESFLTFAVKSQDTIGNINFDFAGIRHPFSVYAVFAESPHGKLLTEGYGKEGYKLYVQSGSYLDHSGIHDIRGGQITILHDFAYIWVDASDATLGQGETWQYVDQHYNYRYAIAEYSFVKGAVSFINQLQTGNIIAGNDTYKVKIGSNDLAGYLTDKFTWHDTVSKVDYQKSYIGVIHDADSSPDSTGDSNDYVKNWRFEPVFLWDHIENYDKDKEGLILSYNAKELEWISISSLIELEVDGSIANYFDFKVDNKSGAQKLVWKMDSTNGHGGILGTTSDGSFTSFELNASTDSVVIWGKRNAPYLETPPSWDEAKAPSGYVFVSDKTGFNWLPYTGGGGTTSGVISGECSGKVAVQEGDDPDYLSVKLQDSNSIGWTNAGNFMAPYINTDFFTSSDGSVQIIGSESCIDFVVDVSNVTCSGLVAVNGGDKPDYLNNKIYSSNESINFATNHYVGDGMALDISVNTDKFISSDESISIDVNDEGVIDFTVQISGECSGLVKVNEDDELGYLEEKLEESPSITWTNNGNFMAPGINPDFFFSSDDTVKINSTETGIDFTVEISGECSGKVAIQEGDDPAFLSEKLDDSPSIEWVNNGTFMIPNIVVDYFISSDESVKITDNVNNLDFTVEGLGKVSVQEGDEPGYLDEKLQDSPSIEWVNGGEFLIGNIVSDYFTSSDESITIIDTGNGLDFTTVGGGKVALNEGDEPDYLANKIYSSNESINFDTNHYDGEGLALDISVNTDKFISSDGSISIDVNDEGVIDFTVSGEFKVKITEDGEEGYLGEKLTDSNSIYWTIENDTMKPEIDGTYFFSSDESVTITETEDGLDFSAASSVIVAVEEGGEAGYLSEKLGDSTSIYWEIEDDQSVPHIEPEYFFSSDESVTITQTENGLDFQATSSVIVAVEEGGEAGYLSEKLGDSTSIYWEIEDDQSVPHIEPEYFFSSDESVTITATDSGLDFIALGNGKVAVQEGDEPDYLEQKLQDSPSIEWINGGSFLIANIVNDYFFSSDESITITATENGLDFVSLGSGKVAVEEGDEPDYLISKLDSDLGTIVIESKGTYVNLDVSESLIGSSDETISVEWIDGSFDLKMNIDPIIEKFTSNDGSITIERLEDDINFEVSESLIYSSDETISVNYSEGSFDLSMNVEPILEKFTSDDGSITIERSEDKVNFEVSESLIGSSDGTITVEYTDGNFDLAMSVESILKKFSSEDGSISISRSDDGVNLEVSESLIGSSDGTITVEYTDGNFDLAMDIDAVLEKFTSDNGSIVIERSGDNVNLEVSESLVGSSDGTISVDYSDGHFDLAMDIDAVIEKFQSDDDSIIIERSGDNVNLELNKSIFTSDDGSVKITTGNGKVDFSSGGGKVAVQEGDEPDYLANKIEIDDSLAGLIQIENTGSKLLLKSALDGNGILLVNNGNISVLPTGTGDCVLGMKGGTLQWIPVASCESACGGDEE